MIQPPERSQMIPGQGIVAEADGLEILAGNRTLLLGHQVVLPDSLEKQTAEHLEKGCTVIYIAAKRRAIGLIALSDTLRPEAPNTIQKIRQAGAAPILLTGDHENAARHMADKLGIHEICADCLPEDKLETIDHLQKAGKQVCMVGDGINDTPALATADIGIAMGAGSDAALEVGQVVLMHDDVRDVARAVSLSRATMRKIRQNFAWALGYNCLLIPLACLGIIAPEVSGAAMALSSVSVVSNSLLLKRWRG